MSKLSYQNSDDHTVFTSSYYRNRGTCCRSNCLHCPYGTTIKNLGFTFKAVESKHLKEAQKIIDFNSSSSDQSSAASLLLASAFPGPKKKKVQLSESDLSKYQFVFLKDICCALIKVSDIQIKKLYLKEHFENQMIDEATLEASLFPR